MRVLIDTCILSELYKPNPYQAVKEAFDAISDEDLFLSVITIGEIRKGITLLENSKRKVDLQNWLNRIEKNYHSRILSIDSEVATIWGEITAIAQRHGVSIAVADGLISATALRYGLHLMTRNVKDFEKTGVLLMNPWD